MQMHAKRPGAGWSWLMQGFTVARRNPKAIMGASALFTLCLLLLIAVQFFVQYVIRPQGSTMVALFGFMMLVSAVLYPVLIGGFMRVIDASRNERPVSALTVFEPFRPGQGGARLALFGLCMLLVYVVFLALLVVTVGHGMLSWYLQLLRHSPFDVQAHALSALPSGFGITLALLTVFFLFYSGALAIGIGQAALRDQPSLSAFRDGIAGAFKNALPLVVLAVCGLLSLFVFALILGILAALVMVVLTLASRLLGMIILVAIYVVMILLMYAFMMGVNYAIWHDVADGGQSVPAPSSLSNMQA